eukprot:s390_g19.t1
MPLGSLSAEFAQQQREVAMLHAPGRSWVIPAEQKGGYTATRTQTQGQQRLAQVVRHPRRAEGRLHGHKNSNTGATAARTREGASSHLWPPQAQRLRGKNLGREDHEDGAGEVKTWKAPGAGEGVEGCGAKGLRSSPK